MSARPHSENGFIGLLLGVVAMATVALFVAVFVMSDGREAPIRTAELTVPVPELPDPPAIPPRSELPASP